MLIFEYQICGQANNKYNILKYPGGWQKYTVARCMCIYGVIYSVSPLGVLACSSKGHMNVKDSEIVPGFYLEQSPQI